MANTNSSEDGRNARPASLQLQSECTRAHAADGEGEIVMNSEELMAVRTDPSKLGQGRPIEQEAAPMEVIQGGRTAGSVYDPLLTPEQVAARLNVSPDWVRDHSSRKTPRLPVIRLGGGPGRAGVLRYRASDIENFIQQMARASQWRARAI
jgi:hypothetical protein